MGWSLVTKVAYGRPSDLAGRDNAGTEQGVTVMRLNPCRAFVVGTAFIGLGGIIAAQAAPRFPACAEIRGACKQAGFVRGHAETGEGVFVDCIAPIMRGTPQPRRASKPLPQISPQLVEDCRSRATRLRREQPSHRLSQTNPSLGREVGPLPYWE
jgi:hypothetical protein